MRRRGLDDEHVQDFKPYIFPHGRRLDGWYAGIRSRARELVVPSLDVEELDDAFLVTAIVPGADKNEIVVSFEDGVVRVAGEMPWTEAGETGRVRGDAQCFRAFSREVRIDRTIDIRQAEAHFEEGVLTARLPFAASESHPEGKHTLLKVT